MGKVEIDQERCKGCQICVSVCPKKIMSAGRNFNQKGYAPPTVVDGEQCTGCALCAEMCPDICVRVWR